MEKRFLLSMLCDLYGPLLTQSRLNMLKLYCEEDLTLQEIAEQSDITRQGVSDAIRHAEKQLTEYEEKLGLLARFQSMQKDAQTCLEYIEQGETDKAKATLQKLIEG